MYVHPRLPHEVCVARSDDLLLEAERHRRAPRRPRRVERRYGEAWPSWLRRRFAACLHARRPEAL